MNAIPSKRRLDHLVLPAQDLEAQAAFYTRLGFKVGPRNAHPWGTENRIVQFDGCFLELITLGTTAVPPMPQPKQFSFGHHVGQWIAQKGDGMSMLVLDSADAVADAKWFQQAGLAEFEPFYFARTGKRPDGSEVEVAFTLAFTSPASMPDLSFFVCQQHKPENFWNPINQIHENGVTGVNRVVVVRDKPEETLGFIKSFAGGAPEMDGAGGFSQLTKAGTVSVWTPDAARQFCGDDPMIFDGRKARFAIVSFKTPRLDKLEMTLRNNNVPHRREGRKIVVPSGAAFGAVLCFEESAA
ncbi:MAG: VOC family protein [Beijerinckiaceae bacterium]